MNREHPSNVRMVCGGCMTKRKAQTQKALPKIKVGGFVKLMFTDGGHKEHMWVKVQRVTPKGGTGVLDNDPVLVSNIQCGTKVSFKLGQIEEVLDAQA